MELLFLRKFRPPPKNYRQCSVQLEQRGLLTEWEKLTSRVCDILFTFSLMIRHNVHASCLTGRCDHRKLRAGQWSWRTRRTTRRGARRRINLEVRNLTRRFPLRSSLYRKVSISINNTLCDYTRPDVYSFRGILLPYHKYTNKTNLIDLYLP